MPVSLPIDPQTATALPAPYWFIEAFKVLGFTLHAVPMNLWYAGTILAVAQYCCGGEHGRRFGARLMTQMPILIAFGINLGIVPLLFLQVGYYKVFYPATILMAWFWMAIFVLLIPAYYGVYAYAFGVRSGREEMPPWRHRAGWLAALLFLVIGFLFANGLSLMTNVGAWTELADRTNMAGAVTGTALNVGDRLLWPRWILMFALALGTTAAWTLADAAWLAGGESPQYRLWAGRWALKLITASLLLFAVDGSWYAFGTWRPDVRSVMFSPAWLPLTLLTAVSPGLVWFLVFRNRGREISRNAATAIGLAQLTVLALNAISRQVVQNLELRPHLVVSDFPTAPQWGPMALFLSCFVVSVTIVGWMLAQVMRPKG
jgi:hypothetical protein